MTRLIIGVYGTGGCGREILPIIRERNVDANAQLLFIDDSITSHSVNEVEVVNWDQFSITAAVKRSVCIAIASSVVREHLAKQCDLAGVPLYEARAQQMVQMDEVIMGDGACISPYVTHISNIQIGRCFHANLYSYVEHDCVIGDCVTLAPSAKCNGNVAIEDHAYIGSNAVIKQGSAEKPLHIGRGAIIGMGAVVTKDVLAGATVIGNPARLTLRNETNA